MADRPLRADARHNREKILRAAREAFAESGYAAKAAADRVGGTQASWGA